MIFNEPNILVNSLKEAISKNSIKDVNKIIESTNSVSELINTTFGPGDTFLHLAAELGHKEIVEALLKAGAGIEKNYKAYTPIEMAIFRGYGSLLFDLWPKYYSVLNLRRYIKPNKYDTKNERLAIELAESYNNIIRTYLGGRDDNHSKKELSLKLYQVTQHFLATCCDRLTPTDKGLVLNNYVYLWDTFGCGLSFSELNLSEIDKNYYYKYSNYRPMLLNFNLEHAFIDLSSNDLFFYETNFKNANFSSDCSVPYTRFAGCDFTEATITSNANFNQTEFVDCNLTKTQINTEELSSSSFLNCNQYLLKLSDTNIKENQIFIKGCYEKQTTSISTLSIFPIEQMEEPRDTAPTLNFLENNYDERKDTIF